jgi:hypothetical protein
VASLGDTRIAHKMFVGNPERKTPLEIVGYDINLMLKDVVWESVQWINLVQDRTRFRLL